MNPGKRVFSAKPAGISVLSVADMQQLSRHASPKPVAQGVPPARQGEPMNEFILVLDGMIQVEQQSAFGAQEM